MFEFIAAKLWFWLAMTFVSMGLTIAASITIIKKDCGEKIEKLLLHPPVVLIIISFFFFIVAILYRTWGM